MNPNHVLLLAGIVDPFAMGMQPHGLRHCECRELTANVDGICDNCEAHRVPPGVPQSHQTEAIAFPRFGDHQELETWEWDQ